MKSLFSDNRLGRAHPKPEQAAKISQSAVLGGPAGSYDSEQANHRRMRQLLAPAFSARRMRALRGRVSGLVDELLDALLTRTRPVDLHEALSVPLPVMVICELLGAPYEDHRGFREWSTAAAGLTDGTRSGAGMGELFSYMRDLIALKRASPGEDVISDLISVQGKQNLSDTDITRMAAGLLFAGHETTVTRIDLGVLLLLSHPRQRDALCADPTLAAGAVEEILRLGSTSAVGGIPRYAQSEITIGEVAIPAGDAVLLAAHVANRDPRAFADPDSFDIARAPNPHLAFGHGTRFCLGASLARIELQAVFGKLFQRLPSLRLAVPKEQLRLREDLLTGGLAELPVEW